MKKITNEELDNFSKLDKEYYELYCVCYDCGEDYNACTCDDDEI